MRTSTKRFLQITGRPGQLPNRVYLNCEHSYVKFPPPGWTSQGKGEGRQEMEREKREGGRKEREESAGWGGGEVSVAWPGQGWNWGRGKEIPRLQMHWPCLWNGAGPAPATALPTCPSVCLSASGVWECWLEATREGYSRGRPPGAEV